MRKTDGKGVSPVIATILMVAITVVLAAVLYVMVTQFIRPIDDNPPMVTVTGLGCASDRCDGRITAASPAESLWRFRVTVLADGVRAIEPTTLAADTDITGGGLTFRYTDLGGEGTMTGGDSFRLSGVSAGVSYEVVFLWERGQVVATSGNAT